VSCRESVKATVKVTLTGPDGRTLRVIEGDSPDPFGSAFISALVSNIKGPVSSIAIPGVFSRLYVFNLVTPSPSSSLGYLAGGFCLTTCPNAGSTPPNSPGIWLFEAAPVTTAVYDWAVYETTNIASSSLITGLGYSLLVVTVSTSSPSSPGDIVYSLINATQSITNTLSSPVNIYTIMLVGAIYGSLSASPVYVPVTFYVFSPPIVFSPGVTMTVSITLSFPRGIAVRPLPTSGTTVTTSSQSGTISIAL